MTAETNQDEDPGTQVAVVIRRYQGNRSISKIERDGGLRAGAVHYYLKPSTASQSGRKLDVDHVRRLANALGAPEEELSAAFVVDLGFSLPPHPDPELATTLARPDVRQLLDDYRALPDADQNQILAMVAAARRTREAATTG